MSDNSWSDISAAASSVGLSITVSAVLIAIAALAIAHTFASAIVRRTAWQIAVLATMGCLALELSGIGQASLAALDASIREQPTPAKAANSSPTTSQTATLQHGRSSPFTNDLATDVPWNVLTQPIAEGFADSREIDETFAYLGDSAAIATVNDPAVLESTVSQPVVVHERDAQVRASDEPTPIFAALAAALWIAGTFALLLRGLVAKYGTASLVRGLPAYVDADDQTAADVRELCARLRFRRCVRLVALPTNSSPIAFGIFRPTIGLPGDFARRFSAEQRQAVLAHELAHLAGGDPFWRWLGDLLVAALWWHPAAWFIRRRLLDASEAVADEASRAIPGGAEHLASALVVLGKRLARRRTVRAAYGAEGDFRSSLGRRVERLLAECETPWRPIARTRLVFIRTLCGAICVVLVLSIGFAQRPHLSSIQGDSDMNTFASSWQQSLCGVALAMLSSTASRADTPTAESSDNSFVAVLQEGDERPRDGDRRAEGDGERRADGDGERPARERDRPRERDAERRPGRERAEGDDAEGRRSEVRELRQRLREIRARLAELGEEESDEASDLKRQAERIAKALEDQAKALAENERERRDRERPARERSEGDRPGREASPEARNREAREIRAKLAAIHEHIRAIGDNDPEEAERLKLEALALATRLREALAPERERERERPAAGERPIVDRDILRARHLRSAIDHLRAAGMQDAADELYRENEELLSKLPDRGERRPPRREDRPGRPGEGPDINPDNPDGPRRPGLADGPGRPAGPPRDADRPRPGRDEGDRREGDRPRDGDRPREERPGRSERREGDQPDAERREETSREAAELIRRKLGDAAKDLSEEEKTQVNGVHLPPSAPAHSPDTGSGARTTDDATRTYEVRRGETVYEIARQELGRVSRWREILELNREKLGGDIDAIEPGMKLVMPARDAVVKVQRDSDSPGKDAAPRQEKENDAAVDDKHLQTLEMFTRTLLTKLLESRQKVDASQKGAFDRDIARAQAKLEALQQFRAKLSQMDAFERVAFLTSIHVNAQKNAIDSLIDAQVRSEEASLLAKSEDKAVHNKMISAAVDKLREELRVAQAERDRTLLQLVQIADRAHVQQAEQQKLREQAEAAKQALDATRAKSDAVRAELLTEGIKLREMVRTLQASLTQKEDELSELRKAKPRDDEQRDKEAQLERTRKLLEDANRQLEERVREERRLRESMEKVAPPSNDGAKGGDAAVDGQIAELNAGIARARQELHDSLAKFKELESVARDAEVRLIVARHKDAAEPAGISELFLKRQEAEGRAHIAKVRLDSLLRRLERAEAQAAKLRNAEAKTSEE
jgi:beta-lactamase regulating signal transducer with metallopeptidase domain